MSSFVRPDLAGSQPLRDTAHDPKRSWRTWLFGRPLSTADAEHEAIGKTVGLAVFASDALSSTAYATQEILIILAAAGAAAFVYAFPIAVAIVVLLAIVTLSYEQTIHAYSGEGGPTSSPGTTWASSPPRSRPRPSSPTTSSPSRSRSPREWPRSRRRSPSSSSIGWDSG